MNFVLLFQSYVDEYLKAEAALKAASDEYFSYDLSAPDASSSFFAELDKRYEDACYRFSAEQRAFSKFVIDNVGRLSFDPEPEQLVTKNVF